MKRKLVIPLLLLLVTIVIFGIYNKDDTTFQAITVPSIYSRYHSDALETVQVDLMVTTVDHYYLDPSFVSQASITDGDTIIAVDVVDITAREEVFYYEEETYYPVTLSIRPEVVSTSREIQMRDARLVLVYGNEATLNLSLGEFTYLFMESYDEALISGSVSALYDDVEGVETVGGVNIELYNQTNQVIDVLEIEVLSSSVGVNHGLIKQFTTCNSGESMTSCLDVETYHWFGDPVNTTLHLGINPNQEMRLFVPFCFGDIPYIHRFVMRVTYMHNGEEKTLIIDDIPYLQTSLFQAGYEEWFEVYREHD